MPFNELTEAVLVKSLPLSPDLNCEHCGFDNCNELIKQIIKESKTIHDCYVIENENQEVILEVNNNQISCNPFVQTIIKNVMLGFLSSLKVGEESIKEAKIKISFRDKLGNKA